MCVLSQGQVSLRYTTEMKYCISNAMLVCLNVDSINSTLSSYSYLCLIWAFQLQISTCLPPHDIHYFSLYFFDKCQLDFCVTVGRFVKDSCELSEFLIVLYATFFYLQIIVFCVLTGYSYSFLPFLLLLLRKLDFDKTSDWIEQNRRCDSQVGCSWMYS